MKRTNSNKRDQYAVVLEDLRSHFKAFGESLDFVRQETKKNTQTLVQVQARLVNIEAEVGLIREELRVIKADTTLLKTELKIVKAELALIRHNQVTRDEFKFLESRVSRLEQTVK